MRSLTHWLLESIWRSTFAAAVCSVVPLLLLLALSIQALVTLRQGMYKGLIVTLGSSLLGVTFGYLMSSVFVDVNYFDFINSLRWSLILSLPIWLTAGILRKTVSMNFALQALTMGSMLVFAVVYQNGIHLLPENIRQPVVMNTEKLMTDFVAAQQQPALSEADQALSKKTFDAEEMAKISDFLVSLFEIVGFYTLQLSIILLARFWQSAVFKPQGFRDEFIHLRSGSLLTMLLLISSLILVVLPSSGLSWVLTGVLCIGMIWLSIVGTGLVHWIMNLYNAPWSIVLIFYFTLLLPVIAGVLLLFIMLAALVDGFVDVRTVIHKLKTSE